MTAVKLKTCKSTKYVISLSDNLSKKVGMSMLRKKLCSAGLVIALFAGLLSGCAPKETKNDAVIMTINGENVYVDQYVSYLSMVANEIENMYDTDESIWTDEENGAAYTEIALMYTKNQILYDYAVEQLAEQNGIVIDKDAQKQLDEARKQQIYDIGGAAAWIMALKETGCTDRAYRQIQKSNYLSDELYNYYFGENGIQSSEEDVAQYFKDNYITAAHVLRKTVDDYRNPLSDEEIAQKRSEIEALKTQIAEGADFMTISREQNEDGGVESNPDGYTFKEGDMVTEFYETAKSLEENQVSDIVETSYGYHIIKRLPLDENYYNENKDEISESFYRSKYDEMIQDVLDTQDVEEKDLLSEITVANRKDYID